MSMIKTTRGWRNLDGFSGEHPLDDLDMRCPVEHALTLESLSMVERDETRRLIDVNLLPKHRQISANRLNRID